MRGDPLYPTFPCRKISLSPRRFPPPAPLGESIAPSSAPVCALGHLPPEGKALGRRSGAETFFRKNAFSAYFLLENASKIGFENIGGNSPTTVPNTTIPKTSEWERAAMKKRGPGGSPISFSPFLGRNGDPAGQAGPRGAAPRGLVTAPTTRRVRTTGDSGPAPVQGCGAAVPNGTTCRQQRPPAPPGAPTPTRRVRSTPQERSASHA